MTDQEQFTKDISDHQVTVLQDSGLYRHLRFRKLDTYCMGFDLITWPGYLCICGDMGTYVFQRVQDMFNFFRGKDINPGYWGEKVEAKDKNGGVYEYDSDLFCQRIKEWLDERDDVTDELRDAVEDEVLSYAEEGESEAVQAACEFTFDDKQIFPDFWDVKLRTHTYHYLWCCRAIQWGIGLYDASKKETTDA